MRGCWMRQACCLPCAGWQSTTTLRCTRLIVAISPVELDAAECSCLDVAEGCIGLDTIKSHFRQAPLLGLWAITVDTLWSPTLEHAILAWHSTEPGLASPRLAPRRSTPRTQCGQLLDLLDLLPEQHSLERVEACSVFWARTVGQARQGRAGQGRPRAAWWSWWADGHLP
jgi:hypothetical protein